MILSRNMHHQLSALSFFIMFLCYFAVGFVIRIELTSYRLQV